MLKPSLSFITLHYAWIIFCSVLALVFIYPQRNVSAIDAYFFGVSGSTESGLNTIDVKDLRTYQQVFIYFIPTVTNMGFINIFVVAVRIHWFKKKFKTVASSFLRPDPQSITFSLQRREDVEAQAKIEDTPTGEKESGQHDEASPHEPDATITQASGEAYSAVPPREADNEHPLVERNGQHATLNKDDEEEITPASPDYNQLGSRLGGQRLNIQEDTGIAMARSIGNAATSAFVLRARKSAERRASNLSQRPRPNDLPMLSRQVTIGRNSQFHNLTKEDQERLGGIEYCALKLLLKIVIAYFFGLHFFGAICLVPWIHNAPLKYQEWLAECGQGKTWWAFYSAQTMVNNLGFTLTPDSMVTFRDATWPMLIMTFLAFAGNTCYPILLRFAIWITYKLVPAGSSLKESLKFLLDHPRRCYTWLFPSRPTWILLGILFVLNFVDVLLIIVLDLDNPAVNDLPMGPRILSAIFQSASSRHTGTSTLNLANINPAVQFSLLVMMYISILPIAISIRASNTYEERALGLYEVPQHVDETKASSYVMMHVRNQLSFDLWYIFFGTFCICVAESGRIVDLGDPAFSVFSVFFEVVSAYANVGLSLGHPSTMTSLSGKFTLFSKLVICAMMIRGRHRGLPYALDRAIMLPGDGGVDAEEARQAPIGNKID